MCTLLLYSVLSVLFWPFLYCFRKDYRSALDVRRELKPVGSADYP
jgi:hypothetical protein